MLDCSLELIHSILLPCVIVEVILTHRSCLIEVPFELKWILIDIMTG